MSDRMLPTGEFQSLTAEEERLRTSGVNPYFAPHRTTITRLYRRTAETVWN
ncbi:Aldose 1-epimerase [Paenibacillus vortex V453]|uniref:Aldose 1-epimerase n=1 Tax=Paenibacillus vortex V453 TaxID=715225 RepID=A0A2R9SS91_9BACL|nr:Aldose 1-epimerase [Paenibacillus vortex V453]